MTENNNLRSEKKTGISTPLISTPVVTVLVGLVSAAVGGGIGALISGYYSIQLERTRLSSELVRRTVEYFEEHQGQEQERDVRRKMSDQLKFYKQLGFIDIDLSQLEPQQLPEFFFRGGEYPVPLDTVNKSEFACPDNTTPAVWSRSIVFRRRLPDFKSGFYVARGCMNAQGKKHGRWVAWYEEGQVIQQGEFRDGKRVGTVTTLYKNGREAAQWQYDENDNRAGEIYWNEDGEQVYPEKHSEEPSDLSQLREILREIFKR